MEKSHLSASLSWGLGGWGRYRVHEVWKGGFCFFKTS